MTDDRQSTRYPWLSRPLLLGCAAFALLAATFLVGLGAGFGLGRATAQGGVWAQTPEAQAGAGPATAGDASARAALTPAFEIFWEAMDLLYRDYDGTLPDAQEAAYSAIRSVLNLLDDPNTSFLTPEEAEFFRTNIEGSFEGIGARVNWDVDADTVVITEPFENQPAWLAGLKRDDLILAVDGESLVGTNLADAVKKIRGPKGSAAVLTIQRPGTADPFDVEVVRDRIEIPTISTDTLGAGADIAYVRLNTFNENSGQLVRQAVEDAVDRDPRALILDLRGNTGGLLREAVKVASIFLEDQTVLLERFSDGHLETYETSGRAVTTDLPLVVLVNEASASASEIVAGALQDTGRATLVGATTFGKGSVQLPHNLSNDAILRVTIARWYTPEDRSIDGVGLTPDLVVEVSDEERESAADPQLDAAIEHLESIK
jgi:carboxyl-terminal processing protease